MSRAHGRFVSVTFPLLVALVTAQEPETDPKRERDERALRLTRTRLEERPTHAALFDRYFKLLVETNSVDSEIEGLRGRLEEDGDAAIAVILGRTLLRAGKEDQALDVLDGIPAKSAEIQSVLGDIYAKLARFDSAVRAYEAAGPAADNPEKKRMLWEKLGKAQLALGKKEAALATWTRIGDLDGGKFHRRLHVAELLTEAGLLEEAEAAYEPLIAETESDPPRHCQVLRDVGRLRELQGRLDDALATYERVLEATARGNWLRKEVEQRVVQIYRRTGRLEALVTRLEAQLEQSPDDLAVSELLADVLLEMRELDRAAGVLGGVSPRFPKDVRLARRLAQLHVERKDLDAAIAEFQRIISERPEELELYLELGTLFARSERLAEAKNQWDKALAQNLKDASLCTRLAAMYALWDQNEDAVRLYRRAIELEPDAIVRHVDLAEFQFAHDDEEGGVATLKNALTVAGDAPRRLEALAAPLREHGLVDLARSCFEKILAAEPENNEIRYALAELLMGEGKTGEAIPMLWHIVESDDRGTGQRTLAANTLVNHAARERRLEELLADAGRRATPGAAFVAGRAHTRQRDFHLAIDAYKRALESQPSDVNSRRLLARLLAEEGDFDGALAQYEQLGVVAPGERRRNFREIAQLHLELYDLDSAVATWENAMRDNPDNPAVFLQVGKEFMSINRIPEALRAFEQAARLRSTDPDVLLRYADALRQFGKYEDAEGHLKTVATTALDARDREYARKKLFELYAEQGVIDDKIASMQGEVFENPYDVDTPQLLADLYQRTGDYLLGLEMIEHAVKFQPRNRELLTRRAELLASLEEWEKVRDVHRELLKFPDADRDQHLIGIGRAEFEIGDAESAKATFRKIRDRGRIRELYDEYRLHDEAIDYFKRAIARNPSDYRSYYYLAEQLEKRSRRPEAIETLERVLNIRPYYRQALELLGKLYVQSGRRDDSVKVGMRLFGLRGEQVEQSDREQREQESSGRRRYWNPRNRPFGQRRLEAARSYFDERGLKNEWGQIIVAEARRRPADESLFNEVRSHFKWRERSSSKFLEFVDDVLAADWSRVRVPPGYTVRGYREKLERERYQLFGDDAALAETRLEQLAGDERSIDDLVERAMIRKSIGKLEAMEADLRAVLERVPRHPVACALLADNLVERKQYGDAVPVVEDLIEWWLREGESVTAEEVARRREVAFQRGRKNMLDQLPRRIRRRVTSDDLREVLARTRSSSWSEMASTSFPESVPARFACHVKLIRLRKAAEQDLTDTVARAIDGARTLAERGHLGRVLFQEGLRDRAREVLEAVMATADELRADPMQVYFWAGHYGRVVNEAAEPLGEILAEAGDTFAAYRMFRDHGHGQKAERVLRTSGLAEQLIADLEQERAKQAERLESARAESIDDLRSIELDYRDAVIKLADYYVGEKEYDRSEEIYAASLELLPDDIDIRNALAALRKRRGDFRAAVATYEDIIDVKRRRRRASAGDTALPPTRLQPRLPDQGHDDMVYSSVSGPVFYSGRARYYSGGWGSPSQRFEVSDDYQSILSIYAERNDHDGVLTTLRKIMQEDPATFRDMSWQVLDTLRNQDLGKKKLPILRILKGVVKDDEWLTLEYGRACSEEGDLKEARRTFEKLLAKNIGGNSWYVEEAEQELEKVQQKLGEGSLGVDDLRARVETEPENVRHRMRLARKLQEKHDYDAALAEARVIVEKAPYMMKAKEMVVEAAAAAGRNEVAIEMLERLYDESTSTNDKLRRGVTLANWLYADGKVDDACAIVGGLEEESGGSRNFSAGNWFLDKNRMDTALEHFERELEKSKARQWDQNRIRQRIARLEAASGKVGSAVQRYLDAIEEASSLSDRESRFKDLLRMFKGHPRPVALREQVEAEHGTRETVEDLLVLAGVAFAAGDAEAGEAELRRAVEISPKEVYLFPVLLGLRRLNDDHDGALAVLDQMQRVYGGSDAMQWNNGVSLKERDRLKLVRSEILEDAGRNEEAEALLESIVDETEPDTLQTMSTIYKQRNRHDKALEWHRRWVERLGTREQYHLVTEAEMLFDLERVDEALRVGREAFLMDPNDSSTRSLLTKIYRELDRLPEFVTELEAQFAKDFRDDDLRWVLSSLYQELDRETDREAIFRRMLEHEDLLEEGLDSLIEIANEKGDDAAAVGLMRRKLELKGGEERKELQRDIAEKLVELDRIDEAEAIYRESLELDTAEGQLRLGRWLQRNDRNEAALTAFGKVLELDDDNEEVLQPFLNAAWKGRKWDEVLDRAVAWLVEDRGESGVLDGNMRTILLDALRGLDEPARVAALEGSRPGEHSLELAAVLNLARGDWPAAERMADKALETDPGSLVALDSRRMALRYQDRLEDLIAATERLREALEKEYVVTDDWSYSSRASTMQDQLGRICIELGDDDRAEATWRESPIRRTPYSNPFGYYRSDWQVRYTAGHWASVRRPERALVALDREFLLREEAPWSLYTQVLEEVGRDAEVEEFAWKRLLDPMELYGIKSGDYGWIWSGGEWRQAQGMQEFLVDFYEKRNRVDELRERAEELLAEPAYRRQARELLNAVARAQNDKAARARAEEERFHRDGKEPNQRQAFELAKLWFIAGEHEKALEYMREVLDFDSPALERRKRRLGEDDWWVEERSDDSARPFSFGFDRSGSSWWSWYDSGDLDEKRALAVAILRTVGDEAKAREVEADLIDAPSEKQRREKMAEIANHYAEYEAWASAARLYRRLLDEAPEDLEDDERLTLLASLEQQYRELGDRAAREATARERLALLEKRLAEAPGPHAFDVRSEIVEVALLSLRDAERAREHVEFMRRFSPRDRRYLRWHARALDLLGAHDRAADEFLALSDLRRLRGEKNTAQEDAWRGLAFANAGRHQAAREILSGVVLRLQSGSELEAEVRDALESL